MPKRKVVKRKVAKHVTHKPAPKSSLMGTLMHKKNRPLHFAGAGIILVLLKGVLALFATVGILLIILSSLAYIWRAAKASSK